MVDQQQEFPKIMRLSVGGSHFQTSLDTLCKDPNSMLAAMFSGRHYVQKDEDGRYFIDRDGTHFRYILNYLRDGNTYLPTENQQLTDELYEEVCFYGIEDLMNKLETIKVNNCQRLSQTKLLELINLSQKPLQLPSVKLAGVNLSFLNLGHSNLRGCDFSACVMIELNVEHAILIQCNFEGVNLKSANLRNSNVSQSSFQSATLAQADMLRVNAKNCNFRLCQMSRADMREGDFSQSDFNEAVLIDANLSKAVFVMAKMLTCNLDQAVTTHANFQHAMLP